jgi:hypothetical protein
VVRVAGADGTSSRCGRLWTSRRYGRPLLADPLNRPASELPARASQVRGEGSVAIVSPGRGRRNRMLLERPRVP